MKVKRVGVKIEGEGEGSGEGLRNGIRKEVGNVKTKGKEREVDGEE